MFLGEIILYNPGKKSMTKQDLEDENARLTALVLLRDNTIKNSSIQTEVKDRTIADLNLQIGNLKHSNQYLAQRADSLRAELEATQLTHAKQIMQIADKAMQAMSEIRRTADQRLALEVERTRSDTLAQCFDRALQTAAGNTSTQG